MLETPNQHSKKAAFKQNAGRKRRRTRAKHQLLYVLHLFLLSLHPSTLPTPIPFPAPSPYRPFTVLLLVLFTTALPPEFPSCVAVLLRSSSFFGQPLHSNAHIRLLFPVHRGICTARTARDARAENRRFLGLRDGGGGLSYRLYPRGARAEARANRRRSWPERRGRRRCRIRAAAFYVHNIIRPPATTATHRRRFFPFRSVAGRYAPTRAGYTYIYWYVYMYICRRLRSVRQRALRSNLPPPPPQPRAVIRSSATVTDGSSALNTALSRSHRRSRPPTPPPSSSSLPYTGLPIRQRVSRRFVAQRQQSPTCFSVVPLGCPHVLVSRVPTREIPVRRAQQYQYRRARRATPVHLQLLADVSRSVATKRSRTYGVPLIRPKTSWQIFIPPPIAGSIFF